MTLVGVFFTSEKRFAILPFIVTGNYLVNPLQASYRSVL